MRTQEDDAKTQKKAVEDIEAKVAAAQALLKEATVIADLHKMPFSVRFGDMSVTFTQVVDDGAYGFRYDRGDYGPGEDPPELENDGKMRWWRPSRDC